MAAEKARTRGNTLRPEAALAKVNKVLIKGHKAKPKKNKKT